MYEYSVYQHTQEKLEGFLKYLINSQTAAIDQQDCEKSFSYRKKMNK